MRITGIIAEFNPFHNGHRYLIEEAKKRTKADYVIVVMSGDFVQRGAPAILHYADRVRMALSSGADLVLELPTLFSAASAETFARAGVSLLHLLGCVDSVVFGSEVADIRPLQEIADILNEEPEQYKTALRTYIRLGDAFPKARVYALRRCYPDLPENLKELLTMPNNILGIEYLRAIRYFGASMKAYNIERKDVGHNDSEIVNETASGMKLRKMIYKGEDVSLYVPKEVTEILERNVGKTAPIRRNDFSALLQYRLVTEQDHLSDYLDFTPALEDKVKKILPRVLSFSEWADALNSRDLTLTRVNRALIHVLLGITTADFEAYQEEDYCMYARMLGFRSGAEPLLRTIRQNTALPLISKMADAKNILSEKAIRLLELDVRATDLYRNVVYQKFGTALKDDYTLGIVKV